MFVRQWAILDTPGLPSARAFAAAYAALGLRWAVIPITWGSGQRPNREPAYWRELARGGIETWAGWFLPTLDGWRAQLDPTLEKAAELGAVGVVLDPEVEFRGHPAEARALAQALAAGARARGLRVAVTTYAIPPGDPEVWRAFAEVAEFGIAQTYDRDLQFDPGYFARALEHWRELGFRAVVLAGSLWDHADERPKNRAEVSRHLEQIPKRGSGILWPTVPILRAVLPVIRRWRVGSSGSAGIVVALLGLVGLAAWKGGA